MESVLNWGIEVVLWFQQFSPTLDLPFKSLTFLGDKEFFLLLMPLVYWCIKALVGWWGGLGAPWLFVHLKLADKEP